MLSKPKITFNAPIIMYYALICAVALFLHNYNGGQTTRLLFSIYSTTQFDVWFLLRLIFHVCGFTDLNIFVMNMLFLLAVGPIIEEKFTSQKIFSLIIAVAIATAVPMFLVFREATLMGADGVIIALLVLGSFTGDKDGSVPFSFLVVLLGLAAFAAYSILNGYQDTETMMRAVQWIISGAIGAFFVYK